MQDKLYVAGFCVIWRNVLFQDFIKIALGCYKIVSAYIYTQQFFMQYTCFNSIRILYGFITIVVLNKL